LSDPENDFRLIIYINSSANHANLAMIGPVDFEIIGLTGIINDK